VIWGKWKVRNAYTIVVMRAESLDLATLLGVPKLPNYLDRVEQELHKAVYSDNPNIQKPLARLMKAHGKRLRPALVLAVVASQGAKIDKTVISGCVAIELIHIGSLIHDDIIDEAAIRWNSPTINSIEGVEQAIVIGDYVLAKANLQAAALQPRIAKLVAATIATLCEGQSMELADLYNTNRSIEALTKTINGKTAALFAAACRVGGLCANLNVSEVNALARYGENFGMAFQMIDDVLDFLSTPALAGKPVGNDVAEGVYTMPVLLSLGGASGKKVRTWLNDDAKAHQSSLVDRLVKDGSIAKTIAEAQKYNHLAVEATKSFVGSSALVGLQHLLDAYLKWALRHLVAPAYQSHVANLI